MNKAEFEVFWTTNAKLDLKDIYFQLKEKYSKETALKIRSELFEATSNIVFSE